MSLHEYHHKRDFKRTGEPKGKTAKKSGHLYVIQKHAASHLHYDFRLELDGVLKSWAVPKGPSLDPRQKRLAVQVEDHPVDYGGFEGIIPQGEYGGGTVMLWDRGSWEPEGDARQGVREGKLKFRLHGEKLHGTWMLLRKGGAKSLDERNWFLIKGRDDDARPIEQEDVLESAPLSVKTSRSLDEIGAQRDCVWGPGGDTPSAKTPATNRKAAPSSSVTAHSSAARGRGRGTATTTQTKASSRRKVQLVSSSSLNGAHRGDLPKAFEPQLATLTKAAPEGDDWLHEIKLDGYRMLCRIDSGHVEFRSRNAQNWTSRLPHLVAAASKLPVRQALLDGEVVALEADGRSSFQNLQNAFSEGHAGTLQYYVFDLLFLNGQNLTQVPLEQRKQALSALLGDSSGPIHYSEHVVGSGPEFFKQACKLGLEGIVSKRRDLPYSAGRGYGWLKIKCSRREEFVIGGYTNPGGARSGFGALLVGYHQNGSKLVYAGKVGTGFSERTLRDLLRRMRPLERADSPFSDLAGRTGVARGAHWIEPVLVAQVEFSDWTRDARLRHPAFQGLREDKPAAEVVRDASLPVATAVKKAKAAPGKSSRPGNHKVEPSAQALPTPQTRPRDNEEFQGVRLTHPEKVIYPEQGITKHDLASYYAQVADWMLPHLEDRPLVLVRCPEGRSKACFFQKHPGAGTPTNLRQFPIREKSKTATYLLADDVGGLISLVQLGALEIHTWGSRIDKLEQPDRLIFDLDPDPSVEWSQVVVSARQIRQLLEDLGLTSFLKTTGGKGLHIVVPIQRRTDWDDAKQFCEGVAASIVAADPEHYTSNMLKVKRTGKIFIDYLRNGRGATAVAPYSTRSRPGAPVSVPIDWNELNDDLRSDHFNIQNVPPRLAALKHDPWRDFATTKQSITAAARKIVSGQ